MCKRGFLCKAVERDFFLVVPTFLGSSGSLFTAPKKPKKCPETDHFEVKKRRGLFGELPNGGWARFVSVMATCRFDAPRDAHRPMKSLRPQSLRTFRALGPM
jgi:hypothetical protein